MKLGDIIQMITSKQLLKNVDQTFKLFFILPIKITSLNHHLYSMILKLLPKIYQKLLLQVQ